MVRPPFMQRRAAHFLSNAFTPSATGEIGLFNDSGLAQLLRIWLSFASLDSGAQLYWTGFFKGRLTSHDNGNTTQIIPDETRVPGRVDTQDITTPHTVDFSIVNPAGQPAAFGIEYPIAIVKPGWTWFMQSQPAPGSTVRGAMLWDWVFADELDEPLSDRDTFSNG